MPNLVEMVHSNSTYYNNVVSVDDEGKEHYYNLPVLHDGRAALFQGYMYRRDWIAKYGANPSTLAVVGPAVITFVPTGNIPFTQARPPARQKISMAAIAECPPAP